ncbi:hypothetical protein PBI_CANTARE_106 [Brevibacterium phage Cantare]|uniref:Uncharacterized protein n=1 Tax=Brevibacterium phage Cantare TaxID=2338395 RepID=A0A3G3LYZ1_9CAUD|nr:hypothetical protein PQD70_gp106 [Brevibacterium phage Cantare]AYQ99326.1 hypothetical protein PBI_CANTARE_106 [Brevibacterium phage Cantare]
MGLPRLMSFDGNIVTVYRDEVDGSHEDILALFHRTQHKNAFIHASDGQKVRYGEIYGHFKSTSQYFVKVCAEMNRKWIGIGHKYAGVLSVHDSWDSYADEDVVIGSYIFSYSPDGFSLRENEMQRAIIRSGAGMDSVFIDVPAYRAWNQKKYNNWHFTNGKGILESTHLAIERKLGTATLDVVHVKVKFRDIAGIAKNLVSAMGIPDAVYDPAWSEKFERYFTARAI